MLKTLLRQGFYVQEEVRPGTGREVGLGHERFATGACMRSGGSTGSHINSITIYTP